MPFADFPPAVVFTAVALPSLLALASTHVLCTAPFACAFSWPCGRDRTPGDAADARVSGAILALFALGLVSATAGVVQQTVANELGSFYGDVAHCVRDVALIAAGHAGYPLAVLVAQTTVWRRKSAVSRCMARYGAGALPRGVFLGLVAVAFAGSAAACLAWPLPQPWAVRPAPPLRTALLTAPGLAAFTLSLLLAAVFGVTPIGEAISVLAGAICGALALATTLVNWVPPGEPGLSLPAAFDERALANTLLICSVLLVWFAAVQWSRRPPAAAFDHNAPTTRSAFWI